MTITESVEERAAREKSAYDEGSVLEESTKLQKRFSHVFQCPNSQRGESYYSESIKRFCRGGVVLDYGCYDGWFLETLIQHNPAKVVGIDISEKGIAEAKRKYGGQADYFVMDAHRLSFPDNTFDVVIGRGILHHLNMEVAVREVNRVLKPGGHAIFFEPLGGNPAAKLIRLLTPKARTKDEKPLDRSDVVKLDRNFGGNSHLFINLFSVPVGMLSSLISKKPNNFLLRLADRIDCFWSKTIFRYWMRQVVLVWAKSA